MKAYKILIIVFAVLFSLNSNSQTRYKGWDLHTSMRDVRGLDISGNSVWAATTGGLFTFQLNDPGNMVKFTTLNGLATNQLSAVEIDNNGNVYAGGEDGSISVYYPGQNKWKYIMDIKNSNETIKKINHFFNYGNFIFISTEFGISKFDVNVFGFVDQPYISLGPDIAAKTPVMATMVVNDTIWAATRGGIAYANINTSLPIQSNWKDYTIFNSTLISPYINTITYFNNKVFFGTDSSMVYYENGELQRYIPSYNGIPLTVPVLKLAQKNGHMYFGTAGFNNKLYRVPSDNIYNVELLIDGITVTALKISDNNDVVAGTGSRGVIINNLNNSYFPNGPYSNLFSEISVDINQNLWGAGSEGFSRFDGTNWKNFRVEEYPIMKGNNYRRIYASRFNNIVWVGGYGEGLLKVNGDSLVHYDDQNSILKFFGNPGFVLVEGMDEDPSGNLWLLNRAVDSPIVNFTQGIKTSAPVNPNQTSLIHLAVDNYITKWMTYPADVIGSERGLSFKNETIPTEGILRGSNLGQDISNANDVVLDHNGEIWVATDNGVSIIPDPYQVIANPNSVPFTTKMRIIENGLATPLTENVQCMAVDALNNKWLGTFASGVIYVSSDGSTILQQFNMTNSPLPSNQISSIAIDNKSGRVYFGTQRGIASFMTVAIEALDDCDKITVGPNPFVIPNDNLLRIDGLTEGSSIKILSISGTVVAEFDSPGGRVGTWDGKDVNGNYVPTGVYVVVGYNKDGSKVCTGKVAVVRK